MSKTIISLRDVKNLIDAAVEAEGNRILDMPVHRGNEIPTPINAVRAAHIFVQDYLGDKFVVLKME